MVVLGENLRNGNTISCGCYHKDMTSQEHLIDISGKIFGRLKVIKRDLTKNFKDFSAVYWICECSNDKNIVSVSTGSLISGGTKSCGCIVRELLSKNLIDLSGKAFGKLTVIDLNRKGKTGTFWNCKCECGNTPVVAGRHLQQNKTLSCGCLRESIIANELKKYFIKEYSAIPEYKIIRNPETNSFLSYDIFIPDNIYIEVHGPQHYKLDLFFHRDIVGFEKSKERDRIKKEYAQNNGVYIEIDLRKIKTVEKAINYIKSKL